MIQEGLSKEMTKCDGKNYKESVLQTIEEKMIQAEWKKNSKPLTRKRT